MVPITTSWPNRLTDLMSASTHQPSTATAPSGTGAGPFAGVLEQATRQMEALSDEAGNKVRGLMTGDGTDVHTALIATQKASLAFDLALAVRNKAVGAYQQLMGMQF